jgi:hypothetical protein
MRFFMNRKLKLRLKEVSVFLRNLFILVILGLLLKSLRLLGFRFLIPPPGLLDIIEIKSASTTE